MDLYYYFFFNDTATTEIYTLSLHDALPICEQAQEGDVADRLQVGDAGGGRRDDEQAVHAQPLQRAEVGGVVVEPDRDRKSTRLNSSHANISYAVFCLKKKKKNMSPSTPTTY